MRERFGAAAIIVAALLVRLPDIFRRPFHSDEAVNAHILGALLSGEGYEYSPEDRHGPAFHYLAAGPLRLAGVCGLADMEAWSLRLLPVLLGVATVALILTWRKTLGSAATAAAAFVAFASPFIYYSGAFIHESLLILLTTAVATLAWRWRESGDRRLVLAGGLCAGLALATKETAVPILGALAVAMFLECPLSPRRRVADIALALATACATAVFFYSDFFRHPERLSALWTAVQTQPARGLGSEHAYPWNTYLSWCFSPGDDFPWSVWILAAFGFIGVLRARRDPAGRAFAVWGAMLFVFHSALPYKTPWLMLSFLLPFAFVAGFGFAGLHRLLSPTRAAIVVGALSGVSLWEVSGRCFLSDVSPGNPLAYSPSTYECEKLEAAVRLRLGDSGAPVIVVGCPNDYWPLPWILRKFPAGYFTSPPPASRSLVISDGANLGEYGGLAPFDAFEIRPGVTVFLASRLSSGESSPK